MRPMILILMTSFLLPVAVTGADPEPRRVTPVRPTPQVRPPQVRTATQLRAPVRVQARNTLERQLEPLGRTVRLRFSVEPATDTIHPVSVTTASQWYSLRTNFVKNDKRMELVANGMLKSVGEGDGVFQISYEFTLEYEEPDAQVHVHTGGSAQLKIGKSTVIATIADREVILSLEAADEE